FPCHPRRQSPDFIDIDIGMIANAPFTGTADDAVQDAIANEVADTAVAHFDGKIDDDRVVRPFEPLDEPWRQLRQIGNRPVELSFSDMEGIEIFTAGCLHWSLALVHDRPPNIGTASPLRHRDAEKTEANTFPQFVLLFSSFLCASGSLWLTL